MVLYAVSCFITAALLVFGLILIRSMVRLWVERGKEQLGARFKTKMVVGAMGLSLLPVVFMFLVSYSLLNRTLGRWFPRPLEIASEQTQQLLTDFGKSQLPRLRALAWRAQSVSAKPLEQFLEETFAAGADAVWLLDGDGKALAGGVICDNPPEDRSRKLCVKPGVIGRQDRVLPSGIELWEAEGKKYLTARIPTARAVSAGRSIVAGYRTSPYFYQRFTEIQTQTHNYELQKQNLRALKRQMLLILLLFTT